MPVGRICNAGKEDLEAALEAYSKANKLEPTHNGAWVNRGHIHRRLGQRDKALDAYGKAIESFPGHPSALFGRAGIYGEMGQWDKAITGYSGALSSYSGAARAQVLAGRAQAYQRLSQWDKAMADLRAAIELSPQPSWQNDLAWLLATCPDAKVSDHVRALALAKKALALAPKEGTFWNTLGVAQYRAGDWKAAVAAFNKSMELREGGDAFDWFFLAMAHQKLGDHGEARKRYDQALEWVEKNSPALAKEPQHAEELRRFQSEAEAVLELTKK